MNATSRNHRIVWAVAVSGLLIVAVWLRVQQLHWQVLLDDEWHALHAIFRYGYTEIFSNFGLMDHSIPLTLAYQAMADTIGLNEWRMRLPSLLAGLATVIAGAAWAWRRLGPSTGLVFGWLLAISPILVTYSRVARPYALVILLLMLAFWAAHHWWFDRRHTALWIYAAMAALGTWLHPLFGPVFMSPLLFFALHAAFVRQGPSPGLAGLGRAVGGGVAIAALTAPLIVPPLALNPSAILGKAGIGSLASHTPGELIHLLAGSGLWPVAALFLLFVIGGVWVTLMRQPRYIAFAATVLSVFVVTLLMARPAWISTGYVLARYAAPLLPGLLLAAAIGVVALARLLARGHAAQAGIMGMCVLLLTLGTPLYETMRTPASHGFHTYHISDARAHPRRMNVLIERMPQSTFWESEYEREIAPDDLLALAPWRFEAPLSVLPVLEKRTGRRIIPAFINGYCTDDRHGETPWNRNDIRLRNALHLGRDPSAADVDVRYLVWKKRWHVDAEGERILAAMGLFADPLHLEYPECEARLRQDFGPPVYDDDWLAVYRLAPWIRD